METYPDCSLSFGFKESETPNHTPGHGYPQIVLPTFGFDVKFNQEIANLMEWDQANPEQNANLCFLIEESYRQMGDCYDSLHSNFFYKLQGNPGESGVGGYPSFLHLSMIDWKNNWEAYVTIFRYMAMEFFAIVNPYQKYFPNTEFIYNKYIPGGWVFITSPRRFYDI